MKEFWILTKMLLWIGWFGLSMYFLFQRSTTLYGGGMIMLGFMILAAKGMRAWDRGEKEFERAGGFKKLDKMIKKKLKERGNDDDPMGIKRR